MTATIGYCDLALSRIGPRNPLRGDLEEIRKASERCATLTQQLLAFSRKQIMLPMVIDLNDIVAEMDNLLRRLIGEDIDLVSVPGKDLGNAFIQKPFTMNSLAQKVREVLGSGTGTD